MLFQFEVNAGFALGADAVLIAGGAGSLGEPRGAVPLAGAAGQVTVFKVLCFSFLVTKQPTGV